ncbi:MAG: hypothetical protein ACOYEV_11360 [Candidatus Nanopelagicales bacterium]
MTNRLHDKFCLEGAFVSTPHQGSLFWIYGDYNMIRSPEGAAYAAKTSQMSRESINALARNKQKALTRLEGGELSFAPEGILSVDAIMSRFPDRVLGGRGILMPLADWATGAPMRRLVAAIVSEVGIDSAVRGASTVVGLSGGLKAAPSHGPF